METADIHEISSEAAQKEWEKGIPILDVRNHDEFKEEHIPGALLVPLSELEDRIHEIPPSGKFLIICRSGRRSAAACSLLQKRGKTGLYSVKGGMESWKGPVVRR